MITAYTIPVGNMSEEKEKVEEKGKEVRTRGKLDASELMAVREMISAWLEKLGVVAKDIVNTVVSTLDGSKLGKEIVDLYNSLKSAGLPENLVVEIVRDFYKKRLEVAPSLNDLVKSLSGFMGTTKPPSPQTQTVEKEKKE